MDVVEGLSEYPFVFGIVDLEMAVSGETRKLSGSPLKNGLEVRQEMHTILVGWDLDRCPLPLRKGTSAL